MAAYLLIWNPKQGRPDNIDDWLSPINKGEYPFDDWSTGSRKNLSRNSRVFLLRCGLEPKGIVASGYCTKEPVAARDDEDNAYYGEFVFTAGLDADQEQILPLEKLQTDPTFSEVTWVTQNCQRIPENVVPYLEVLWKQTLSKYGKQELEYPPSSD